MNIKNNIVNYLYDRDYIVSMYDDYIYVFNFKYLDAFDDVRIAVSLVDRKIKIVGDGLSIVKMTKEELLVKGNIKGLEVVKK